MKTKNLFLIIICLILFVNLSNAQTWRQTNGPLVAGFSCVAHPNGDLYAGSGNGLLRSSDNGDSWHCIGSPNQPIGKIFISNSGYIFNILNIQFEEYVILRSTDNGVSWHLLNLPLNLSWIDYLRFEDDGIGNIYIATYFPNIILRSTDGGDSWDVWSQITQPIPPPHDLLFYDNNNYIFMSIGSNKIYRLINNNWVEYVITNDQANISSIEVTHNGVLLAGSGWIYAQVKGIFRSLDNGITWQRVFSNNIENLDIYTIVVNSAGVIFAGTSNGVFKSTDDGASWNQIGLQCSRISSLVCPNSYYVIANSGGGTHRWNDLINIWEDINNRSFVGQTYYLTYDQTNHNYFAATSSGVFRTSNGGETWHHILSIGTNFWFKILIDGNPDFLYANGFDFATVTGKLYRSPDRGVTWELLDFPVSGIYALMTTSLPGEIWCGSASGNIHYSSDYGVSWTEKYVLPSAVKCLKSGNIQGYMFAGTDGSGFYRSTNSGNTWREFNIGLLNYSVESIAMNSTHDIFIGTHDGIYRSTDLAGNWQFVGLSQDTVSAIAINSLDYILAGTLSGHIYISTDNGENWNDSSSGLNTSQILSIVLDENDFAMVGTYNSGVYRSYNAPVDIRESDNIIVTSFDLFQNYPNPFNPSTTISWQSPVGSWQTLKVYDVLGNEVLTLLNEYKPAGRYEVEFSSHSGNVRNLPSGVYFYQLKAGEFVSTKKMILIK